MQIYLRKILDLLGEDKKKIPFLMVFFLFVSLLDVLGIGLIGPYIGLLSSQEITVDIVNTVNEYVGLTLTHYELIMGVSVSIVVVFVIKAVSIVTLNYLILMFSVKQQVRLRSVLMCSYQNMPYERYVQGNSADYIHNAHLLVAQFTSGVVMSLLKMISDLIVVLAILMLLAITDLVALMVLVSLLVVFIWGYDNYFKDRLVHMGVASNEAASKIVQGINEGLEGIKEVRILGKERFFYDQVRGNSVVYGRMFANSKLITMAPRYLLEVVVILFVVLLVLYFLMVESDIQELIPILAMFGVASVRLIPASNMIVNSIAQVRFNLNAIDRLHNDIDLIASDLCNKSQIERENGNIHQRQNDINDPFQSFKADGINFLYPESDKLILRGISFEINAGESIGIIGSSGSGKTTMIDVLLGLLCAKEGEFFYNNQKTRIEESEWLNHIAYLPQQVFLIDTTLELNIALGEEEDDVNQEQLHDAIRKARLTELIKSLPNGVKTMMGERGVRLSGGQRQRVALARAFYHQRDVLVMDEATSALDNETEKEIVNEIRQLKGKITMIVIAHRLTTVQHCDRIYRIEKGEIESCGTPKQILG